MTLERSLLLYVTGLVCALGPAELCHVGRLLVQFVCSVLLLTFFEDTDAAASTGCMSLVVDNRILVSLVVDRISRT